MLTCECVEGYGLLRTGYYHHRKWNNLTRVDFIYGANWKYIPGLSSALLGITLTFGLVGTINWTGNPHHQGRSLLLLWLA